MSSALDYIDIDISIDDNNLCINQKTIIRLDIKNISNDTIENGLFEFVINERIFKVLDFDCKSFVNNFANLGNIEPGFKLTIELPVSVNAIPDNLSELMYCYISFHLTEEGNLLDFTYKSDEFVVDFISKM
ncbi:MAG: hypothetical protein ACRC3Y_04085, partial [Romboutsia sp.]|uniref:hypothetical protein n=1 Tax=Romboutsia sp. TaxID=1965302 RepID=UPI003F3BC51D